MFKVELYGRVRRAVLVEGGSERWGSPEFGISRETVRKMLRYAVPPAYRRQQPVSGRMSLCRTKRTSNAEFTAYAVDYHIRIGKSANTDSAEVQRMMQSKCR